MNTKGTKMKKKLKHQKDGSIIIKTANGKTNIYPVYCEVTGKIIGWQTNPTNPNATPAYLSLNVISVKGNLKISTKKCTSF